MTEVKDNFLNDFYKLYGFLDPSSLSTAVSALGGGTSVSAEQANLDFVMEKCLGVKGIFKPFSAIKKDIEGKKISEPIHVHIIGNESFVELGNDKKPAPPPTPPAQPPKPPKPPSQCYWTDTSAMKPAETNITLSNICKSLGGDAPILTTVVIGNNPYVSPGKRGTREVEFFLNYIPPHVASSLIPYFELEFELIRGGPTVPKEIRELSKMGTTLSTPSILRFLAGSINADDKNIAITDADRALNQVTLKNNVNDADGTVKNISYSGMEMFLMPQTLSNMDTLGTGNSQRLVPVKPFVPFMSVESFQVTIRNAGAGAFAKKTAQLKIKIHDKSRLVEISEFLRGPVGYRQAVLWTTYGWLAPRRENNKDDAYSKFINENMINTDCWQVYNSQFAFDVLGQVSLSIELISKGSIAAGEASITLGGDNFQKEFKKLKSISEEIAKLKEELFPEGKGLNEELRATVLLNVGAQGNFFDAQKDNTEALIKSLIGSLSKKDNGAAKALEDKLKTLTKSTKFTENSTSLLQQKLATDLATQFSSYKDGKDPFLGNNSATIKKLIKGEDSSYGEKNVSTDKFVSFGKLFLSTVIPSIIAEKTCDEIQVLFYGLNENCGPIRGASIAEFPVRLETFKYALNAYLKEGGLSSGGSMTVEEYLKTIISTQFSDKRALGYGMRAAYEAFDPKSEKNEAKLKTDGMNTLMKWVGIYGDFVQPEIEFYIEVGKANDDTFDLFERLRKSQKTSYAASQNKRGKDQISDGVKIIKRIHIFDKTLNPYKLLTEAFSGKSSFEFGSINEGKLKEAYDTTRTVLMLANKGVGPTSEAIIAAMKKKFGNDYSQLEVLDKPSGTALIIGKDRKSVRDAIARTAPNIVIGTNGSMITTTNFNSKTNNLAAASNIVNLNKNNKQGGASITENGLENPNGLPMRAIQGSLTMTSKGCPIAQLYQQYFIDFQTGTTLDNMYNCTQIQHMITPGKFDTNWTFIFTDGYSRFAGAQVFSEAVNQKLADISDPGNIYKKQ